MSKNQEIDQASGGNDKTKSGHGKPEPESLQVYKPRRWLAIATTSSLALTGAGGFAWLYWTSLAFSDVIDGLKFLTEGSIALALLLVAIVQACVYWSQRGLMAAQWNTMERSLKRTDRMIDKMQEQLVVMQDSLTETRNIIDQNERSLVAYFGIKEMKMNPLGIDVKPEIEITYVNGGQTPAWHFNAWFIGLILDTRPESDNPWSVEEKVRDIRNTFIPAGKERTFTYSKTDFVITQERLERINDPGSHVRLYAFGTVYYTDISGPGKKFKFCGIYNPHTRKFGDFTV